MSFRGWKFPSSKHRSGQQVLPKGNIARRDGRKGALLPDYVSVDVLTASPAAGLPRPQKLALFSSPRLRSTRLALPCFRDSEARGSRPPSSGLRRSLLPIPRFAHSAVSIYHIRNSSCPTLTLFGYLWILLNYPDFFSWSNPKVSIFIFNISKVTAADTTENIKGNCFSVGQLTSFKYLGSLVNGDNSIEEEVKRRITLGNKAYIANKVS